MKDLMDLRDHKDYGPSPLVDQYAEWRETLLVGLGVPRAIYEPEWDPFVASKAAYAAVRAAGLGEAPRGVKLDWMTDNGHEDVANYLNGHLVRGWIINRLNHEQVVTEILKED